MKKVILIFSLLLFVFCDKKQDIKTENIIYDSIDKKLKSISIEPKIENIFENNLFLIGELDKSGNLITECDCCLSEAYFVDDNKFIYGYYCLEGDDYGVGKYKVTKNGVNLYFYGEMLSLEFDLASEVDTINLNESNIKYKITQIKNHKTTWMKFKNSRFFKTNDGEFAERNDSLKENFFERIKIDKQKQEFLKKYKIEIH